MQDQKNCRKLTQSPPQIEAYVQTSWPIFRAFGEKLSWQFSNNYGEVAVAFLWTNLSGRVMAA
jgi:hypothetical protein